MKKLAKFIVKFRLVFAVTFLVLAVAGAYFATQVKQNYDMTKYLPDDTDTSRGLAVMKEEFGLSNNVLVMLSIDENEVKSFKKQLANIEGVQLVTVDSYKDGMALYILTLNGDEYSDQATAALSNIRTFLTDKNYVLIGSVADSKGLEEALKVEIPVIMVIALVIIFLVLLFTSHSWLEPLIFGLVLMVAVLINMGSNFIFGEISYITFAVSAILQIALAMDYSIILLHGFTERKESGLDKEDALIEALAYNMRPISSSGLTTIAGLIALLFMTFTIGFDIGMVLAKGILISLLTVILFMPSLIIILSNALEKTKHRPVRLGGGGIAKVSISLRAVLPILMVVVIAGSYIIQMGNTYSFSGWQTSDAGDRIAEKFGNVNQAVIIIGDEFSEDKETQERFIESVSALSNDDGEPAVKSVNTWTNLEVAPDVLTDGINFDEHSMYSVIEAILGEDSTIGDAQLLWENCGGDVFEFEITRKMLADLMGAEENDRNVGLLYSLCLNESTGKATVGSALSIYDSAVNSQLLGRWIRSRVPESFDRVVTLINANRADISDAMNRIVAPTLVELAQKYGADTSIYNIEADAGNLMPTVCKVLFGSENFKVHEFYEMWQRADENIMDFVITEKMMINAIGISVPETVVKVFMSMISQDGDVTVGELLRFVSEHKDSRVIKEVLGDRSIGICVLAYIGRDLYVPTVNDAVTALLATLRENFVGPEHCRMVMLMDLPKDGDTTFGVISTIKVYADKYFGEENYLAGESMTVKDVSDAFSDDLFKINLVTVISIFLIIALLFRSITLPIILVFVIQGAIWITMALQALRGIPIFFMSYIICVCIQMGATIDYGILISSNFRRNRATMPKFAAIVESVKAAMPTIFTSGLILIAAGFIIGFVSSVMPIYSIGRLLGLGTIISILLILFLLPALLYIFDKVISLTTFDGIKVKKTVKVKREKKKDRLVAEAVVSTEENSYETYKEDK